MTAKLGYFSESRSDHPVRTGFCKPLDLTLMVNEIEPFSSPSIRVSLSLSNFLEASFFDFASLRFVSISKYIILPKNQVDRLINPVYSLSICNARLVAMIRDIVIVKFLDWESKIFVMI